MRHVHEQTSDPISECCRVMPTERSDLHESGIFIKRIYKPCLHRDCNILTWSNQISIYEGVEEPLGNARWPQLVYLRNKNWTKSAGLSTSVAATAWGWQGHRPLTDILHHYHRRKQSPVLNIKPYKAKVLFLSSLCMICTAVIFILHQRLQL